MRGHSAAHAALRGMTVRSRWWAAIAYAGLTVLIAGTCGLLLTRHGTPGLRPAPAARAAAQPAFPAPTAPIVAAAQTAQPPPVATPAALTIPEIAVSTRLITLGLTAQGTVQVPSTASVAGWYTRSPRPGAVGPAIILGHIDSYQGPGVFFRLAVLRSGDPIYIRRSDGSTVEFRVTAVQSYLKDHFPAQAVYGPTPDAELRLITCGGVFDSATGHYLSNIVVYATETS
jgi:sortase (surface protein transpeptidase)